jgi:hypothetical protein
VGAVAIATIVGLGVGVGLVLNSSYNRSAYIKADSEAALLLAEAGVNEELNLISTNLVNGRFAQSTAPVKLNGEPYPGRKGFVPGAAGNYWVYTSADAEGTRSWEGDSTFYITCNAVVNGASRKVRVGGPNQQFQSPFGTFAVFGLDDSTNSSNAACVSIAGSAVVEVNGYVGTNGRLQDSGSLTFTKGFNYNYETYQTSSSQLVGSTVFLKGERFRLPSVTDVIKQTIPETARMTDTEAWNYVRANRMNTTGILQWKTGLSGSAVMGISTTTSANFPSSGSNAYILTNKSGGNLGAWQGINTAPGSSTKRTLIFQPGDYYFETLDLQDNVETEMIIDTAGVTVSGGNPLRLPVRFFIANGGQQDQVQLQIKQTKGDDPGALRVYYSKPGSNFNVTRPSSWPNGTTFSTTVGVYAVTNSAGGNGTTVTLNGGSGSSDWLLVNGSFITDKVVFKGRCRVSFPGEVMGRRRDPISGVGYSNGYTDG